MSTLTKKKSGDLQRGKSVSRAPKKPQRAFVTQDAMLTVDDWLALPDTKPRYELIEGKLVQKMTTTSDHAWAAGRLLVTFTNWAQEKGWMFFPEGMAYKADLRNGFVPDVVGFSPEQNVRPGITQMPTPFLVVEVLSRSTAKKDRTRKREYYALGGVQMYLIIDTSHRTLEVLRLQDDNTYGDAEVLGEKDVWQPEELPGLKLELQSLWMS
jgi:Uma2 family endonuclease